MPEESLTEWRTVSRRTVLKMSPHLTVESHQVALPDGRVIDDWAWVIAPDSAVILPITADGRYLCFRQTKYAVKGTCLAPIGGMIEDGETPQKAAERELLEETGYEATDWVSLGAYVADPNRGVRTANLFLAQGITKVAEPASDDLEEQHLVFLSRAELTKAFTLGQFKVTSWAALVGFALLRQQA